MASSTIITAILMVAVLIQVGSAATSNTTNDEEFNRLTGFLKNMNRAFVGVLYNFHNASSELPKDVRDASFLLLKAAQSNEVDYSDVFAILYKMPTWTPLKQLQEFLLALNPMEETRDEFTDAMNIMQEFATNPNVTEAMGQMVTVMPSVMEMFIGLAGIGAQAIGGAISEQAGGR